MMNDGRISSKPSSIHARWCCRPIPHGSVSRIRRPARCAKSLLRRHGWPAPHPLSSVQVWPRHRQQQPLEPFDSGSSSMAGSERPFEHSYVGFKTEQPVHAVQHPVRFHGSWRAAPSWARWWCCKCPSRCSKPDPPSRSSSGRSASAASRCRGSGPLDATETCLFVRPGVRGC